MARLQIAAVALLLICSMLLMAVSARYVDRHRELQDVVRTNNEEEIGALSHEQAVILAEEKGSTAAKATSAVHVPHVDASTADH